MAPLPHYFIQLFLFYILFVSSLFNSSFFLVFASSQSQIHHHQHMNSYTPIFIARRTLLDKTLHDNVDKEDTPKNKKSSISSPKNQTKTIKPTSSKNQTKLIKPTNSTSSTSKKNQSKLITSPKNKTTFSNDKNVGASTPLTQLKLTKNNLNSTKSSSSSSSKSSSAASSSLDLKKTKSTSSTSNKEITKTPSTTNTKTNNQEKTQKQKTKSPPTYMMYQDDDDLISDFRDLPIKFQKTFLPDLQKISTTSKIYLTKANKEITKNYIKPYVGNKYASSVATAISCAFIVVPFLLVSLIFNRIKAYFSLQKLLIFIQIYLSIYFLILCLSSLITGLEPLRFFYATSQSTYVWLQVLQTLGYVMYLLMLLMYLILVFSTETGLGQKFLGLGQTFVGFAVGLHYYMTVFHRVLLHQPPKTNWKIHGIYATCFLVICLFAHAERRKKVYFVEDGEEGKQS